ncbi:MAG: 50S ribosomal protein L21 [Acidobacteria bacterium RBG_16_68_9]|nr:MAG: 50S ribosomal protein L21 [Acidobacteria bacterium RBG_16_68_9]
MHYAVIRTGGKQYRVTPGEVVRIEKVPGEPGTEVQFTDVLMACSAGGVQIGMPIIQGARVTAQVLRQAKAKKILVFKKKKRKNYRRRQGHRQQLTTIRVTAIETGATEHGA